MPVNTSSTGATYGKSSDPLCPLGFHPQVRWPTRCKRCFRDYKEHSDASDKAKFGNLDTGKDDDPWSGRRTGFQKSRSLDVNIENTFRTSRLGAAGNASSAANATTASSTATTQAAAANTAAKNNASATSTSRWWDNTSKTTSQASSTQKSSSSSSSWWEDDSSTSRTTSSAASTAAAATTNRFRSQSVQPDATTRWRTTQSEENTASAQTTSPYTSKSTESTEDSGVDTSTATEASSSSSKPWWAQAAASTSSSDSTSTSNSNHASTAAAASSSSTATASSWSTAASSSSVSTLKGSDSAKRASTKSSISKTSSSSGSTTPEAAGSGPTAQGKPSWARQSSWDRGSKLEPIGEAKKAPPESKKSLSGGHSAVSDAASSLRRRARQQEEEAEAPNRTFNRWKKPSAEATPSSSADLKDEISRLKGEIQTLKVEHEDLKRKTSNTTPTPKPMSFESAKATETASELRRAKSTISDQEISLSQLEQEKKGLNLRIRELETLLEKRPNTSETQKSLRELETKLKFMENKNRDLERENDKLQNSIQTLEGELEEVQDNFREDEADEYRTLKRELETSAKNCRVLQFKLKKAEKTVMDLTSDKADLENRRLEKDLEMKVQQNVKLESQLAETRMGKLTGSLKRSGSTGPVLSRTGSVERSVEDQLLKDLQDSVEREHDLKEQLQMAEEESTEMRMKLSRLEDENESLVGQLKKMSSRRRSPSPAYSRGKFVSQEQDEQGNNAADLKLQLEVSEQETSVLRKKVDTLLSDNLKLTKEVKEANASLTEERRKKASSVTTSRWGQQAQDKGNSVYYENKIEELQSELSATRVKLIEKDRELERVEAQYKTSSSSRSNGMKRSSSQDEDLAKKLEVIEKEAKVLRDRNAVMESENERLLAENKSMNQRYGRKPPSSTNEKLQMDKFALEEKVRTMESKIKEQNKKMIELQESSSALKSDSIEVGRLRREKSSLENELSRVKDNVNSESKKLSRIERDLASERDKADRTQRELIAAQREKRHAEEDKTKAEGQLSKLESELRTSQRERERLSRECEAAKALNTSNLAQTQEGIRHFKEQLDTLKDDLQEEKRQHKETKKEQDKLKRDVQKKTEAETQLNDRVKDLEDKWAKSKRINQQRKDKIENLEKQLAEAGGSAAASKFKKATESNGMLTKKKFESLEEEYVTLKANLTTENEELRQQLETVRGEFSTVERELAALRATYNTKADDWIKEKLEVNRKVRDLEDSIRNSAGEGWDAERERFKHIIEDRDSQITQLKIEGDVARSQASSLRKDCEDLKLKLLDYEKMSKFQKVVSTDSEAVSSLEAQVEELKKQVSTEQREKRSEVNLVKMKLESKVALLSEEITALKSQCSKYRRERETYKDMVEGLQKNRKATGEPSSDKEKAAELQLRVHVLEDELAEAKLDTSKINAESIAKQANYEIQLAELKSKINELEEEALIESGRARIAGTRTKMELAWQKERESQKKLIAELNTMSRDLKSTLLEVEKERNRERLESKRKIDTMKTAFDDEQEDTRKQITDLQYDLLELRDAHAKLRTTNDKLKREKDKSERDRDEFRNLLRDRSRVEQGEDKKVSRFLSEMDTFMKETRKLLNDDTAMLKTQLPKHLTKLKESRDELEQIHRLAEEEREKSVARREQRMRRTGSVETDAGQDSPSVRGGVRPSSSSERRTLYRKTVSIGETISEAEVASNLWRSTDSTTGSRESLASNASIPLPVPVRTRSSRAGPGAGSESDAYNHLSIRRLERDTSVDRLSTGSRESMRSTQSEWVTGSEKKKKTGLINKLKKLTRGMSQEREKEFGSGSDISSVSIASSNVKSGTLQRKGSVKKPDPARNPAAANEPFDKYFHKASTSGVGGGGGAEGARPAPAAPTASSSASSRYGVSSNTTYLRR